MMASSIEAEHGDASYRRGDMHAAIWPLADPCAAHSASPLSNGIFHDLSDTELKLLDQLAHFSPLPSQWDMLRALIRDRILHWAKHSDDGIILGMTSRIAQLLNSHQRAPFTCQRICELVLQPKTYYTNVYKYLRAFLKVLNVTSSYDDFHSASKEHAMQLSKESLLINLSTDMLIVDAAAEPNEASAVHRAGDSEPGSDSLGTLDCSDTMMDDIAIGRPKSLDPTWQTRSA